MTKKVEKNMLLGLRLISSISCTFNTIKCGLLFLNQLEEVWSYKYSFSCPNLFSFKMGYNLVTGLYPVNEPPHEETNNLHGQKKAQISFAVTDQLRSDCEADQHLRCYRSASQ